MKYEEYNEDYGRNEFALAMENESRNYSALQSLFVDQQLGQEEVKTLKESKMVQHFLDSSMGHKSESTLKRAFAAAVVASNEQGTLPFRIDTKNPMAIAAAVDEGLTRAKTAYQVAQGVLDPIDAEDNLIDAAEARVATVTDAVVETGASIAVDTVTAAVVSACPPAVVFVPVIKAVQHFVVPKAKNFIRKGVKAIAKGAKAVVRSAVKVAKKIGSKIKHFLFG